MFNKILTINWLLIEMDMQRVYCDTGIECLNTCYMKGQVNILH